MQQYPTNDWDNDLRNHHAGQDYKEIKNVIFSDQGYLCAYCETKLSEHSSHQQRIEHFHPKSDNTHPTKNWALAWDRVLILNNVVI